MSHINSFSTKHHLQVKLHLRALEYEESRLLPISMISVTQHITHIQVRRLAKNLNRLSQGRHFSRPMEGSPFSF